MNLLWFSHFVPFPPRGGPFQRSFNLIRQISKTYAISLVAFNLHTLPEDLVAEYSLELKKYCKEVEVWELPARWRGARWLAEASLSLFYSKPFSCRAFWSRHLAERWQTILERHKDALLHFDSLDLALYAGQAEPFHKVLNHHNCESALTLRRAEEDANPIKRALFRDQAFKLVRLERAVCPRFDVNTVVSELDASLLAHGDVKIHTHVVDNGVDTEYFKPIEGGEEPHTLLFTGLLRWVPNISAMRFFEREVWPPLKARYPDILLYLAGKDPPGAMMQWPRRDSRVRVVANPDDMRPWLARASVFVCPILEGGGTRIKILDAMSMARPVVSTPIGCEGLRVTHGENILIAENARDFARAITSLLENETMRMRMGAAGRALVEKHYRWERVAGQLEQSYRCALNRAECGRNEGHP